MTLHVTIVPILKDNYAFIAVSGNECAVIDPGEPVHVIYELERLSIIPKYILCTHHHGDHIGGAIALRDKYGAQMMGPKAEERKIPSMDKGVQGGDTLTLGDVTFHVIDTPGHTDGHICFHAPAEKALFCGDVLFAMGCGRVMEGAAKQMWNSLSKIAALPDDTHIYCGHEYTVRNAEFCLSVEKDNADMQARLSQARKLRANDQPTIPTTVGLEKKTNVFLRTGRAESFAVLRRLKDSF